MNNKSSGEDLLKYINSLPTSPNGLYDYPGQNVVVPTGGNITMEGIDYPVLGISMETGEQQLMQPGGSYDFVDTNNVLEIPQYQDGGAVNFFRDYITSPKYTERLLKSGDYIPQRTIQNRLRNLNSIGNINFINDDESEYQDAFKNININKKEIQDNGYNLGDIIAHEYAHGAGAVEKNLFNGGYALGQNDINNIKQRTSKAPDSKDWGELFKNRHDRMPTEIKADIDTLRFLMKRDNLYDAGREDFKKEHLNKADKQYKDNEIYKRLKNSTKSSDDLMWIMNNIASNESNDEDIFYAQDGGRKTSMDYSYDVNDIRDFMNSMVSAPWYKERLENNGYDPNWVDPSLARSKYYNPTEADLNKASSDVVRQRLSNLKDIKFEEGRTPQGSAYVQRTNTVVLDGGQTNSLKAHPRSVVTHEFSHGSRKRGYENSILSKYEQGVIHSKLLNKDNYSHVNDPEEAKSDMDTMRYNLYKAKKFDPKTGQYQTPDGKFNPSLLETIKNDYNTKRMRKAYGDKSLSFLMNTIAMNDNQNEDEDLFYAQDGGVIRVGQIPPVTMTKLGQFDIGLDDSINAVQIPNYDRTDNSSTFQNYDDYVLNMYRDWENLEDFNIVDSNGEEFIPSQEFGQDDNGEYVDMRLEKFFPNGDNFYNRTYLPKNLKEQIDLQRAYQKGRGIPVKDMLEKTPYTEQNFEQDKQFMRDYIGSDDYRNLLSNYYPDARREQADRLARLGSVGLVLKPQEDIQALTQQDDMHVLGFVATAGDGYNARNLDPSYSAFNIDPRELSKKTFSKDEVDKMVERNVVSRPQTFLDEFKMVIGDGIDNKAVNIADMQKDQTGVHELGHFVRNAVSPNQFQDILKRTKNVGEPRQMVELPNGKFQVTDYVRTPTEITSRLDAMRYLLKQNGVKDTTKSLELSEKELQKALENPKIKADGNVQDLIESTNNAQDLLWLLNNIVDNNSKPGQDLRAYMG